MARVLMAASEAAPLAKTGGLADVVGALPKALVTHGHDVAVVMPRYGSIRLDHAVRVWDHVALQVGTYQVGASIWEQQVNGVRFYLLDCPPLYDRPGLYNERGHDYADNSTRFAAFCQGALAVLRYLFNAGVLHLHDWQSALCAAYLRTRYQFDPIFDGVKIVYTIHNLEHQGRFGRAAFGGLGLDAWLMQPAFLEYYGDVNFMKAGIAFSDAITTVSPRYAEEIQTPEFGFGLDGFLRAHAGRLTGILNGCDYSEWNPEHDPFLARHYSAEDPAAKRDCKLDLLLELGLHEDNLDKPLLGMVTRFARQKGIDLFMDIGGELLANDDVCLAVVGSGDREQEDYFRWLASTFPGRVSGFIGYSNKLAHKVEAGADIFLMPSRFEPCGLNQMYSLRYGTVPVVRATGGLDDSVDGETGFKFWGYGARDFLAAIRVALAEYRQEPEAWAARMKRGMTRDYSWAASAQEYSELYRRLRGY